MNTFTIDYPNSNICVLYKKEIVYLSMHQIQKIDIRIFEKGWKKHIFNINIERKQTTCFAKIKTDGNNGWLYLIRQFSLPCQLYLVHRLIYATLCQQNTFVSPDIMQIKRYICCLYKALRTRKAAFSRFTVVIQY